MDRRQRDRLPLLGLAALALLVHGAILAQNLAVNPLAATPVVDAEVYWEHAGRIASGELVGDRPFLSAPLYPYLLGLARALGFGLTRIYVVQLLLHVATGLLIGRVATRRFGPATGLTAAGLWYLSTGPAYYVGRVLACTLQAFLAALVLERAVALSERATRGRLITLGALLGLFALAWPPALLLVPLAGVWVVLTEREDGRVVRAASLMGVAALTIAPATLHNVAASGEWIAISAQGGITFYHGNNAEAEGTFSGLGVTSDKRVQDREALEQARAALGEDAGWKDASSYFFAKGFTWQRANPGSALALAGKKSWLYASSRVYGDIYMPYFEREEGIASRLWLAPFPVAWWTLPALVAAFFLARGRGRRFLPELALLLLPIAICTAFWYSPRYRMPGTPAIALFGGWALVQLFAWQRSPQRAFALGVALFVGIASGFVDRAAGIDSLARLRPLYELRMGDVAVRAGDLDAAVERYRRARDLDHPDAATRLANLERELDPSAALADLARLADERPDDAFAQRAYAVALAQTGRAELALAGFSRAVAIDPNDYEAERGWGSALIDLGRPEDALPHFERALEILPTAGDVHFNRGVAFARAGRPEEAIGAWRAELALDPGHDAARGALVQALLGSGREAEAVVEMRTALGHAPNEQAQLVLAWTLATSGDDAVRDGREALELARQLERSSGGRDPYVLDTLAAALAATGDFDGAVVVGERAIDGLGAIGDDREAGAAQARVDGYRAGRPYRAGE